jgi:hypothetical protein
LGAQSAKVSAFLWAKHLPLGRHQGRFSTTFLAFPGYLGVMNRNRWLLPLTIATVLFAVVYHVWSNWGLVTIHANQQPLSKVIREIEKQGHVTLKTDLPGDKLVTMDVHKVVVTEALETLATVTDARWRLTFVVAGDKASVNAAIADITGGRRPQGWKSEFVQPIQFSDMPDTPLDPRRFVWTVNAPAEPKMQAYLASAANQTASLFLFPETWNPDVASAPKSGPIVKVLPKLADAVKGESETLFFLQGNNWRNAGADDEGPGFELPPPPTDGSAPAGGGRRGGGGGRNNPAAMEERAKAQLAQLPPALRARAEAEIAERRAMFESMQNLTPEERRAKMEEMASDAARQEKMEARAAAQEARRSPEQRIERSHKYVERKAQFESGAAPTGGGGGGGGGGGRGGGGGAPR